VKTKKMMTKNKIYLGENLTVLDGLEDKSIDLIYIDPPFNTGKVQTKTTLKTTASPVGDRVGFGNRKYRTEKGKTYSFNDLYSNYVDFLYPRLLEARRVLKDSGSIFVHLDYREVHYCKVYMDTMFGRECFMNEIIWAYDFGGRSKKKWPAKHDNILWYVKDKKNYTFNYDQMERIPYMAPGLVGKEKAARGKTPTDVFWHTIVPTNGSEKTGYPTQKPLGILKRIISVHSNPGDLVLDFFCGSGTTGEAAGLLGRSFILVDNNPEAVEISMKRLAKFQPQQISTTS